MTIGLITLTLWLAGSFSLGFATASFILWQRSLKRERYEARAAPRRPSA